MARIRYINPEFFTDDRLAELPPLHRIFFAGMWCHADREGRLDDKPKQLKVKILPYDNVDIDVVLKSLDDARLINRYSINNVNYIQINNFLKYQRPHHTEKPSSIPSYNGEKTVKHPSIDGEKLAGMGMVNGDGDGERLMGMVNGETPLPPFQKGAGVVEKKPRKKTPKLPPPDKTEITAECLAEMEKEFPELSVSLERKKFYDYLAAHNRAYKDYNAAFRNWMRSPYPKSQKGDPGRLRGETGNGMEIARNLMAKRKPGTPSAFAKFFEIKPGKPNE